MKKNILLLVSFLLFTVFLCAAEGQSASDWIYEVQNGGTAVITAYTGTDSEVVIPDTVDGYTVTAVGDSAFPDCEGLTSVSLPGTLTYIGKDAFRYVSRNLVFTVSENSYGELWARVNNYRFHYPDEPEVKSRVTRVYESLLNQENAPGTFHLSYRVDFLLTGSWYESEIHSMDGTVLKTMTNYRPEGSYTRMYKDGMEYNLFPEEKTGSVDQTFTVSPGGLLLLDDDLYTKLSGHAWRTDYSEHTRRMNGETYTAEVFPEDRYISERAFYFNREGQLVYYYEDNYYGSNPSGRSEVLITILELDQDVDISVFDLSDYDIKTDPTNETVHYSPSGN